MKLKKIPQGFKIVKASDTHLQLHDYAKQGALRGKYLGFPNLHKNYTMSLPGVTDWLGLPRCFTKEQLIITKKGNIPINEIKEGDFVFSFNTLTKKNEFKRVSYWNFHKTYKRVIKIKMKDGTIIKCTEDHKFFDGKRFVEIIKLINKNH